MNLPEPTSTPEALTAAGVRVVDIPNGPRQRYFVRIDKRVQPGGFSSRLQADEWIDLHRRDLDWRAGYVFRLKGLRLDIEIIDAHGVRLL